MVLFSKLFVFASIPCYVLSTNLLNSVDSKPSPNSYNTFDAKREYDEIKESIETDLEVIATEHKQIEYLKVKLANTKLRSRRNKHEYNQKIENLTNQIKQAEAMVHACLTRQALENVERFAFPPVLYKDDNLSRYAKWMLALYVYKTPILDAIREELRVAKLTYGAFARAADNVHSLISKQFARPKLESYAVPRNQDDIKAFCSFLDKMDLDKSSPVEPLCDGQGENKASSLHKEAAFLACWVAFKFPAPIFTPEFEDELCYAPVDWYSATIFIQDINESKQTNVERYLEAILEEKPFKDNVNKMKSVRIPLQMSNKNDPSVAKKPGNFDLIFHLVCKPFCEIPKDSQQTGSNGDYFATEIRKRLSDGLKKTVIAFSSLMTYAFDVPEKYRPTTTRPEQHRIKIES